MTKNKDNPHSLTLRERMTKLETNQKWLIKGYWLQTIISVSTFISVLGLILKLGGIV